jgi:hypothetical protein
MKNYTHFSASLRAHHIHDENKKIYLAIDAAHYLTNQSTLPILIAKENSREEEQDEEEEKRK